MQNNKIRGRMKIIKKKEEEDKRQKKNDKENEA